MKWSALTGIMARAVLFLMVHYKPTQPENLLNHTTRQKIQRILLQEPMLSRTALQRRLGCSPGTVTHHLQALKEGGVISSIRIGRSNRYYTPEINEADARGLALLRRGRIPEVAKQILEAPGITQTELTQQIAVSRKVIRSYLDDLIDKELAYEDRNGLHLVYSPGPELRRLLDLMDHGIDPTNSVWINLSEILHDHDPQEQTPFHES